jgi:hypothetical protein
VIGQPRCHCRTLISHPVVLFDLQTARRSTEIVGPYREPTHPAVIATGFGKGQRLADLPLMTQPTGAVVTRHDPRVYLRVTSQIPYMCKMGFAMNRSHLHALHSPPFVALVHLSIGQPLTPAHPWTTASSLERVATTEDRQAGRFVAGKGIGKDRGQVPGAPAIMGILPPGQSLFIGSLAHDQREAQLAVSRPRAMIPLVTGL